MTLHLQQKAESAWASRARRGVSCMTEDARDPGLVALASMAGAPVPSVGPMRTAPPVAAPIPFIENKIYDLGRVSDLLSLSISQNHHANGGPVSRLLETMVASLTQQPEDRRVIAVSSGTAALHMACGMHALKARNVGFRWVTSAFNFFSARVGPLSGARVIDCDAHGGFDLDALRALPPDSYDGVVYTNVFAQQSDWNDIAEFCRAHGKTMVVDNATGLLDRPAGAARAGAPIEIISAHHTKPWGVGEGGFILCDAGDENILRHLSNFAARLPAGAAFAASNYKLSDLSAAAIIDRLERMPSWSPHYHVQERRMHALMAEAGAGIEPFAGATRPRSPRAHTPFLCPVPVDAPRVAGPVTLRKYYRPLPAPAPTPNADALFARIFSLSNAPEMQLASGEEILSQVRDMLEQAMTDGGNTRCRSLTPRSSCSVRSVLAAT
jgi:dTDP-4-amino-4,6-dideoxygalactose transaminase